LAAPVVADLKGGAAIVTETKSRKVIVQLPFGTALIDVIQAAPEYRERAPIVPVWR